MTGSPIESAFLVAFQNACRRRSLDGFTLLPQQRVCGLLVDFIAARGAARAVVECDGHDYHERTKEQARRDRSFDRAAQRAGYRVLRFTGQEINRDAERCAVEVIENLLGMAP